MLISDSVNADKTPPRCGIRAACRWFAQDGPRACGVCPLVVYRPTGGTP
ncbi:hypothetical protein [Streptomyces telluris]|uniref:Uncharacterized protein n=1 Tax=Streptomyces telluris TaxID=2720021 RepID=A0A9X2RPZ2_9ACTN|nr:hypothetical protein [Streptomyces telluris]MCQ8774313.1 hypothetical protein [Streptomyces telluris]